MSYYFIKCLQGEPFDAVVQHVTDALKREGFGVLTRIDVRATMKEKLGEDMADYVILGACNPKLAFKALSAEEDIGLLLPCNVVVYEDGKESVVGVTDPAIMSSLTSNPVLSEVASEATRLLDSALSRLSAAAVG